MDEEGANHVRSCDNKLLRNFETTVAAGSGSARLGGWVARRGGREGTEEAIVTD